jgi:hypothetical protein
MNSMSIATHCAMLLNGGKRIALDKKPQIINGGVTGFMADEGAGGGVGVGKNGIFMRPDELPLNRESGDSSATASSRVPSAEAANEIAFSTVFYVTHEGLAEIRSGMPSLAIQTRRALLMVDGYRTAADLSLRLRGGEAERILRDLEARKLIGRMSGVGSERPDLTKQEKKLSAARLEEIKQVIVRDLRERLGRPADFVLNDVLVTISSCENALELRAALRNAGDVLVIELGEVGVIGHVRAIGKNVMELIAESD